MKKMRYISALVAVLLSINAVAQELKKEITIDKDIVPELKESNKMSITPQIPSLTVTQTPLSFIDRAKITNDIPSAITNLEPAENVDTMELSPYRGYAMVGYFPIYNLDLSAGYRFIDGKKAKLNAWLQYNGKTYDGTSRNGDEMTLDDHELAVDVDYTHQFGQRSQLSATAGYAFNAFSYPWEKGFAQNVHRANVDGVWKSSFEGLKYNVGLGYSYFGYTDGPDVTSVPEEDKKGFNPVKEHVAYLNAGANLALGDYSRVALDFEVTSLFDNKSIQQWWINGSNDYYGKGYDPYNRAVFSLTPHYDLTYKNFKAKLGVKLDFQTGDYTNKNFMLAPDVTLDWTASKYISAYARVGGGVYENTMNSIFEESHYFSPLMAYDQSELPLVVDAGVSFGPFVDATIELFGGYAMANDWYMPIVNVDERNYGNFNQKMRQTDIRGWHVGVAASYSYKKWGKIKASYIAAPQQTDKKYVETHSQENNTYGYFMWRDRAKHVVNASLIVTPISSLDISLDYEYRGGRHAYERRYVDNPECYSYSRVSLGNVNNLSLGGLYRFTDQWSFFARLENLFNHKYELLYDIPSQGLTGLVGATYKF